MLMDINKRRLSDNVRNSQVSDSKILWKVHESTSWLADLDLDFTYLRDETIVSSITNNSVIESQNFQIWQEMENIDDTHQYSPIKIKTLSHDILERWDIIYIDFMKSMQMHDTHIPLVSITFKFLVKYSYSSQMYWYIMLCDNKNKFTSKAREEKFNLPIMQGWKRHIIFSSHIKDALVSSLNEYTHEWNIQQIVIYKKYGNKKWISWIKKLWDFFKSKIENLVKEKNT
jgi:hypothetical protein